jgi:hypothetical protein
MHLQHVLCTQLLSESAVQQGLGCIADVEGLRGMGFWLSNWAPSNWLSSNLSCPNHRAA